MRRFDGEGLVAYSRRRSISLLWGWVDVHVRFSFLYNEELNMISLRWCCSQSVWRVCKREVVTFCVGCES